MTAVVSQIQVIRIAFGYTQPFVRGVVVPTNKVECIAHVIPLHEASACAFLVVRPSLIRRLGIAEGR